MALHRNGVVPRRRRVAWVLGLTVSTALAALLCTAAFVVYRTPSRSESLLRTALDGVRSRRLSSIELTPGFRFDGSTSDVAQHFYRRYLAGATADPLSISESDLPARIRNRLDGVGLRFGALTPLLQRALIWDSGYVQDRNPDFGLIRVYSVGGVPMSEIAVPLHEFGRYGCTTTNCTNPDGLATYRSKNCTGDQMLPLSRCASEQTSFDPTHTSMWATGGDDSAVQTVAMFRHVWNDPVNKTDYTVFAVHTLVNEQEPAWDNCPGSGRFGSLIIPCAPYEKQNAVEKKWLEPRFGTIVTAWLDEVVAKQKRRKLLLFVVLPLGAAAFVVLLGVGLWCYNRRRLAAGKSGCCSCLCGSSRGPVKDIWGRSIQHTLLSPSPGASGQASTGDGGNVNGSGGSAGREGYMIDPSPHQGDGELLHKKLPRKSSSSAMTVSSDRTSVAAWDRMTHVLLNDLNLYNKRVALERIRFQKQLSKGGFGDVWFAELDTHPIAVKRLLQSHRVRIEDVEAFVDEIQITASLHHPNIPRFLGVAWTTLDRLCMVIEYLPGGDLQSFLKRPSATSLTWPREKRTLALGIAKALQYLHSRAPVLIHRDVKSRNILIREQPLTAKVTDFGVSRSVQRDCMTLGVGTPYWTAPEVLGGTVYTEKSDIYSFGVVLSEIDTLRTPYHEVTTGAVDSGMHLQPFHLLKRIMAGTMQPTFAETCPVKLKALALRCLDVDPVSRPTAKDVVKELELMTWE